MKSFSKKFVSLILAAVMVLSLGTVAFATDFPVCYFDYHAVDDNPGSIYGYSGPISGNTLTVPNQDVEIGLPFNKIEDKAFLYTEDDDDVAFAKNVRYLIVEAAIEEIGVIEIGELAFANFPALETVTFKGDVVIGNEAFKNCKKLKSVTFEGNADLGNSVFAGCTSLAQINVNPENEFDSGLNCLTDTIWFNDKSAKNDFIMLGTTLIAYTGLNKELSIPLNVTKIGRSAFEGNQKLEKVVITRYVDTLGDRAFAGCSALKEVEYADFCDIVNVGADVFVDTPYYDNYEGEFFTISDVLVKYKGEDVSFVVIPNTIKHIADEAFMGCYKYTVSEKEGYTFVIDSILVPASVETFGKDCFALVTYEDGTMYAPRIYAYSDTASVEALKAAGYLVNAMSTPGDVDNDGDVDVADARLALRLAVKLDKADERAKNAADVDKDGAVTASDARIILRIVVGLEGYSGQDLINKPSTTYEILSAYKNAVKYAEKNGMGYLLTVSNTITSSDVNKAHRDRIEGIVSKNSVNNTFLYTDNTKVAQQALPTIGLESTKQIKSAKCTVVGGKYVITITFNDVVDADLNVNAQDYTPAVADFMKLIPTVSGKVFYDAFANDTSVGSLKWWNFVEDSNTIKANCVRKYQLTYTNPTITMIINPKTGAPVSVALSVGYKFAIDGRINGLDVSSSKFKTGDAIVTRLDAVKYTNFGYNR